ncbi:AAA family ATPase [Caminibacter pacificus]|uniref:AAA family ATPase n=1 Tax=Caminibacter pacificus TaxID=1424653 RepID=A0AAJ4UYB8_9BACT|nr:AAA family ATPase [Caminibacter pacificus]NPA87831.1 AAA domain-containing protein [Campylobacterota bacterium]QCI28703.1 AAA family ATPase [Caminibacter pacificus]ROR40564.1 MoxR-like ATPase [Caminibacter pacificus]
MEKLLLAKQEIQKAIIGHEKLINSMLIGLITNGHILIEGVPGIAKTTAVKTLGIVCDLSFKRIQFTPDLLPSDITGVEIYNPKTNEFQIKKGPIFANLILADEINRAPAKVQSALLEAMQERQVTIAEESFKLPSPFMVLATQNPIEQEGTYPLPEAQLDRFMLKVKVGYNSLDDEVKIVKMLQNPPAINKILSKEDIFKFQEMHKNIHIDDELIKYIARIVDYTRHPLNEIKEYIELGASPRATISLVNASKANAMLKEKDYVTPMDIIEVAPEVLRHRIILNYKAQADEVTSDEIIKKILEIIPIP